MCKHRQALNYLALCALLSTGVTQAFAISPFVHCVIGKSREDLQLRASASSDPDPTKALAQALPAKSDKKVGFQNAVAETAISTSTHKGVPHSLSLTVPQPRLSIQERIALSQPRTVQFNPSKPWLRVDPSYPKVLEQELPHVSFEVPPTSWMAKRPALEVRDASPNIHEAAREGALVTGGLDPDGFHTRVFQPWPERNELPEQFIGLTRQEIAAKKGRSILLIGEGYSPVLPHLVDQGHRVRALDLWYHAENIPEFAVRMRHINEHYRNNLIPGSVFKLPFESGVLDEIWANRLLNNLPRRNLDALDEMWRVIKPGGEIRVDYFDLPKPELSSPQVLGAKKSGAARFPDLSVSQRVKMLKDRFGPNCRIEVTTTLAKEAGRRGLKDHYFRIIKLKEPK